MKKIRHFMVWLLAIGLWPSCEDILEVPDISNEEVLLVAPLDNTVVQQSEVNFTWNGIADVDAYWIQVATPNFTEAAQVLLDSIIVLDSTFAGTKAVQALTNGDYEWRVKGVNSAYGTPFSSSAFTVNAPDSPPTETPTTEE